MKKRFLVLAVISILASMPSFAQEVATKLRNFRIGMRASPQICWMRVDFKNVPNSQEWNSDGARLGINWGPFAEIALSETFLIQTGVDINYHSGKIKGTFAQTLGLTTNESLYKMRFIEVPLLLKFRTNEIGYMRYFGVFGLGAGFRYRVETTIDFRTPDATITSVNNSGGAYINAFRGSMQVGAGAEYSISGNTSLVFGITFNNGITNILKQDPANDPTRENAITNMLSFNVGILF